MKEEESLIAYINLISMRNIVIITLVVLAASLPNLDAGVKMAKSMF